MGVDVESKDVMTVWLSREIYQRLIQNGIAKVRLNRSPMKLSLEGEGSRQVIFNRESKDIPVIYVVDNRNGSWTFHKDPKNPILVEYSTFHYRQFLRAVSTSSFNKMRWVQKSPPIR